MLVRNPLRAMQAADLACGISPYALPCCASVRQSDVQAGGGIDGKSEFVVIGGGAVAVLHVLLLHCVSLMTDVLVD